LVDEICYIRQVTIYVRSTILVNKNNNIDPEHNQIYLLRLVDTAYYSNFSVFYLKAWSTEKAYLLT